MRVHEGGQVTEFALSSIDSLSFYYSYSDVVTVPAGVFVMGDGEGWCGIDEREVTLTRDFHLGQHEVTNQEYLTALQWAYDHGYVTATTASVIDALDGSTEELLDLDGEETEIRFGRAGSFYLQESSSAFAQTAYPAGYDPANHPVKEVTWYGAARYCDWLSLQAGLPRAYAHSGEWSCNGGNTYGAEGYRLPTDAEWEYAAQYHDERTWPWGNGAADCGLANYRTGNTEYCVGWTLPVGSRPDAPQALGLADMAGNSYEWCDDRFQCDLGTIPTTDPVGPASGSFRVIRSGAWIASDYIMRCASRREKLAVASGGNLGFRIARTAAP